MSKTKVVREFFAGCRVPREWDGLLNIVYRYLADTLFTLLVTQSPRGRIRDILGQ